MSLALALRLASLLSCTAVWLSTGSSETNGGRSSSNASALVALAAGILQDLRSNTSALAADATASEVMTQPLARLRGSFARSQLLDPAARVQGESSLPETPLQPCAQKEACLQIVDAFLARQPRQGNGNSLLQAYDSPPQGGGGPCGALCYLKPRCVSDRCKYYIYDNAVAAIYFAYRGKLSEAKTILDSFKSLLYPQPGNLRLLHSAYAENGDVLDWSIDTGNNAWAGMAFVHYAAVSGEACYAHIARDLLHSLADQAGCDDELQGFMGRLPRGRGKYRATEHNIDMFSLARMLGEPDVQGRAASFVSHMYGFNDAAQDAYATGTAGKRICDPTKEEGSPTAADTQFWNLLSDADPDASRKKTSLESVLRPASEGGLLAEDVDILGDRAHLLGVRFTTKGSGAQWENTASAVMGIGFYNSVYKVQGKISNHLQSMQEALLHQLQEYRSVLASVRGGNYHAYTQGNPDPIFPGGSDTGLGWSYLRYPHLAATAWTGLMLLEANPFAPPNNGLPTTTGDWSCLATR